MKEYFKFINAHPSIYKIKIIAKSELYHSLYYIILYFKINVRLGLTSSRLNQP